MKMEQESRSEDKQRDVYSYMKMKNLRGNIECVRC